MSYTGYKSSPRGFSRGGYRGSSRGGDGGSWRGSGRGYSGSSRGVRGSRFASGGGKWEREPVSSYDSRSRYNTGGGERYSSHGRDDGSYRSYRDDSISSYSSRDHAHRTSSPERKRIRTEYVSPASSMHRSHDYGDGVEYSSRSYGGYENKRQSSFGGGDERRNVFREERERIRSDDYEFRKPIGIGGLRHSTPRGSYRGTNYRGRSFSRGLRSGFRRTTDSYRGGGGVFLKRRGMMMESYGPRRRIATGKSQEYLRRLKLYRLQRLKRLRERAEKEGSDDDDDDDDEEEEIEEEVEEEVTDEDNEDGVEKDDEATIKKEADEDEDMEEGGDEKKEKEKKTIKKVKKVIKVVKKIKRKVPKVKEADKTEDGDGQDIHVTVKQDSEGRDVDGPVRTNYLGQPFMKLECPHCHTSCTTFKEYVLHLYKPEHQTAMSSITMKVRKSLAKLRLEQRTEQRELDEECKLKKMNMRTFTCLVCKLNYRSLKSEHLRSDKHKEMMNLLNPYCKICRISCSSPMMYENHVCSLNHLKRKYYYEKKNADKQDGSEIDMDKYMVLDQVGSGEEESDSESSDKADDKEKEESKEQDEAGEEGEKEPKEKKPKKKKKLINLGSEYCKKMEVYFCDLCKSFLPRIEDQEQALAVHCRGSNHLRWYVKKKDDLALRKRAERIHRMREEQRKALLKEVKDEPMDVDVAEGQEKSESESKTGKSSQKKGEGEEGMNEKVWSEVSKDIGDLLREVEDEPANKSSDDEEDTRAAGRRYDRFKHSEKGKAENANESESKSVGENKAKAEAVNGDDNNDA